MFTLATSRLFTWPVTVRLPDPVNPGAFAEHGFIATFEAIGLDEAEAIEQAAAGDGGPLALARGQAAVIMRVLKGWADVVDADGRDIPFTPAALAGACGEAWFRTAVIAAYAQAISGQEARRKN